MSGIKSVCMFHGIFHKSKNSLNESSNDLSYDQKTRDDLMKLFRWNISMKNNMIINCVKTGKTSREGITRQEYKKTQAYDVLERNNHVYVLRRDNYNEKLLEPCKESGE